MKIKILIAIFCLGLFFGINNSVNAATDCVGDLGGQCVPSITYCSGTIVSATGCTNTLSPLCCKNDTNTGDNITCTAKNGTCGPKAACAADKIIPNVTGCGSSIDMVCCSKSASSTTKKDGCCVIDKGNCKTVSSQAECTGAQAYDPDKSCDQYADICTADPTGGTITTTEFVNPITANSLEDLLDSLLSTLQGLVAIIAIIMLIVGGMMYMFAGVDEKMVETAKKTIGGAVIGVAIVFAAPAFLKEIQTILCGTGSTTAFCAGALDSTGVTKGALTLKEIAENILNFLLSIVGILGIIGLMVGGGFYLTAYGDEERIKKGKDIITASLTGIIIASAALIIVKQIAAIIAGE